MTTGLERTGVADLLKSIAARMPSFSLLHEASGRGTWAGDVDLIAGVRASEGLVPILEACDDAGFLCAMAVRRRASDAEIAILFGRGDPWSLRLVRGRETILLDVDFRSSQRDALDRSLFSPLQTGASPTLMAEVSTAYLVLKRLRKGQVSAAEWRMPDVKTMDLGEVERLLARGLSPFTAASIVGSILDGEPPTERAISEALRNMQRIRSRSILGSFRVALARIRLRPGMLICIAGPDGTGKSTLAAGVDDLQLARDVVRLHWRPGLLPPLGRLGSRRPRNGPSTPHAAEPRGAMLSLARLTYYWCDFVAGYWIRIWPHLLRGRHVVLERGWHDMWVDQRRYQIRVTQRIFRALSRFVPRPDLHLVLSAPPSVVRGRKQEISAEEIGRQLNEWDALTERLANVCTINVGGEKANAMATMVSCIVSTQQRRLRSSLRSILR